MQIKKYPHKNLNKNRILYFQSGLCVILLLLLVAVEWKSYSDQYQPKTVVYDEMAFEENIIVNLPKDKPILKAKPVVKNTVIPTKPNDNVIKDPVVNLAPQKKFDPNSVFKDLMKIENEPIPEVSWLRIEDVPIFPGCEEFEDNEERRLCMNNMLSAFIAKHFDTSLSHKLGLRGRNVIYTNFKVSHTGEVIFLNARNPNPKLVEEAQRVIEKLPKMTPGMQRGNPVNVIFGLPINLETKD